MRPALVLGALLLGALAPACSSSGKHRDDDSKYVEIHTTSGQVYYALRSETEKRDAYGCFTFENQITHRKMKLKASECEFRSVSRSTVSSKRIDSAIWD